MCFCTWFPLLLFELDMQTYLYVKTSKEHCWVYSTKTRNTYYGTTLYTVEKLYNSRINRHNKDNLDKALLLISLGLPHKEIENLLGES